VAHTTCAVVAGGGGYESVDKSAGTGKYLYAGIYKMCLIQ
jgi:hypothetical protein